MTLRKPTAEVIGQRIKRARKAAGIASQRLLGERLDPPKEQTTVSDWESGNYPPNALQIVQIARLCQVSPMYLLGLTGSTIEIPAGSAHADRIVELAEEIVRLAHTGPPPEPSPTT